MLALLSLLSILFLLWLINRIATVALTLTGLSRDSSTLQARSALLGVGFTTSETELIVQHPVRRQIIMWLMVIGNTGLVTAMVSVLILFIHIEDSSQGFLRVGLIVLGIVCLWLTARSTWLERNMQRGIEYALRRFTDVEVRDYDSLMQLSGGFGIMEWHVSEDDWFANQDLRNSDLRHKGILVLGIYRDEAYIGAPKPATDVLPGDLLVLYGAALDITRLREMGETGRWSRLPDGESGGPSVRKT